MSLTSQTPFVAPRTVVDERADILDYRVLDGEEWDRAIAGFDGVCQEQLFAYAQLRWPGVALEPVLFSQGGRALGGALVMLQRLPLGLATIALVKWGPFLADNQAGDAEGRMAWIIDTLVAEYVNRRGMMVSIMPKVEASEDNRVAAMLAERGFRPGVGVRYPLRYVVDVTLDDDTRMAAFGQKWRYNLRKSLKAGLDFEMAAPHEVERFMALYQAMSERKLFPDFSGIATVEGLMAMPEGTARPELFFVRHGEKTVAGAVIFTAGDTACYLYGATDDAALDLRAGYFLHWHIIRWLRDNSRAKLYDLGGTDGFAGLHQFKSGMVGEAGHISPLPPVMNHATHWRAHAMGAAAYKGREILTRSRDAVLAARLDLQRRFKRGVKA
ncbi:GNAT family N-acetyltransferase [Pelagibacterium sp. H642]|uniref:lipid II:glycine glycyltransferase FemX n=1 Tax=Pelagibacterium sp. H642 TaxID=1881069 RepID=UPI0028163C63|nr:GNAT family N-acetyltransferase [Pelagibacterium sp. H642]WMT89953.1 GNAT family N-acetyltransferase [Pelagibacterium sp. H642]